MASKLPVSSESFYSSIPGEGLASVEQRSNSSARIFLALSPFLHSSDLTRRATIASLLAAFLWTLAASFNSLTILAIILAIPYAYRDQMANAISLLKRVALLKKVPTVEGHWLFGQTKALNPNISLANWRRWLLDHPRILRLRRIPLDDFIVVHHPDTVNKVLRSSAHRRERYIYSFLQPWLGTGLVPNCEPECVAQRKLLAPALSSRHAVRRSTFYRESVEELELVWESKLFAGSGADKAAVVDVQEAMQRLSLDVILRCAYSYSSRCQRTAVDADSSLPSSERPADDVVAYARAVPRLLSMVVDRLLTISHHVDRIYWRSAAGRTYRSLVDTAHSFTRSQVERRMREQQAPACSDDGTQQRREDFLDALQKARSDAPSIREMSAEARRNMESDLETLVFAGHDTSATALSWTLYYLSVNPTAQERCFQEAMLSSQNATEPTSSAESSSGSDGDVADNVAGGGDGRTRFDAATASHKQSGSYLAACAKEAMRLSSVVPFIHRRLGEDTELAGHVIPAGTRVMVSLWGLHHNETVWASADEFRPERFLAGDPVGRELIHAPHTVRDAFVPFSAGSRSCLGQRMAMEQVVGLLGLLVRQYRFSYDESVAGPAPRPCPTIVMHSSNGMNLLVEKR